MSVTNKTNLYPRALTTLKERLTRLEYNMKTIQEKFVEIPSSKAVVRLAKKLPVYSLEDDGSGISFEMVKYAVKEPTKNEYYLTRTIPSGRNSPIEGVTLIELLENKWFVEVDVNEEEKKEYLTVEIKGANNYKEDVRAGDEVLIRGEDMEDENFFIKNQWVTVGEVRDGYVTGLVTYKNDERDLSEKRYTARIRPEYITKVRKSEGTV